MTPRSQVLKTLKLYVGGKFIRSESGRVLTVPSRNGAPMYAARTSRKDIRNAVETARKAQTGWAGRTAFNRGQILYRLAEMLEDRAAVLPTSEEDVAAATDRVVHYAGWSDKITALLSTLNPVAATYVNYSRIRPLGIVAAFPNPGARLLGLVDQLCACTVMGNTVMLIVDPENAELATALSECLATCDMPAGVVNVLTGDIAEVLEHVGNQDDVDGLLIGEGAIGDEGLKQADHQGAEVLRRIIRGEDASRPCGPIELSLLAEVQTVWMSAYEPHAAGGGY
jgi:acyl-CoA reductase-like NAD-dependent aldehyde dehydrogenase